jgi:hypothetical protein
MRLFLALGVFCLAALAFSGLACAVDCEEEYNSCITACCSECGSYTTHNSNGDLVCYLGTADSVNQPCVDACLPCSNRYQECIQYNAGSSGGSDEGSTGCCGCCGALILPALGAVAAMLAKGGIPLV